MIKFEQDMNLLNIVHQEYEIYFQNQQYVNIKIRKIKNLVINPDNIEEFKNYIIDNINNNDILNTKLLLFIIVNNIVDIRNLWLNRDNEIIINTTYYSFSISNISQNSDKTFEQIMLYKQLLNELIHRKDINECIDEYMKLNLNGSQLAELENLRKIMN